VGVPVNLKTRGGNRAATVVVAAAVATQGLLISLPADAAPVTVSDSPSPTYQTNGRVNAIITVGNKVYIGGDFSSVRPAGSGTDAVPRKRLAAFAADTGQLLPWSPTVNSTVNALAASPNGHRIYVGGRFGKLGGKPRHNLGAVNAVSGNTTKFRADTDRRVLALAASGKRVYVGGKFLTIRGKSRSRLAALAPSGRIVTKWRPPVKGYVRTIAVSSNHKSVFIGGDFKTVGRKKQAHLARLSVSRGQVQRFQRHPAYPVDQIVATAHRLYLAGNGAGGHAASYSTGGHLKWVKQVDGAVHSVAVLRGALYVGGQFANVCVGNRDKPTMGFNCPKVLAPRRRLVAFAGADGSVLPWNPSANSILGVFAVTRVRSSVQIGGDFTLVHGVDQEGYAAFSPAS
jgi:hypothetical protein